jgi:hypothetical protein
VNIEVDKVEPFVSPPKLPVGRAPTPVVPPLVVTYSYELFPVGERVTTPSDPRDPQFPEQVHPAGSWASRFPTAANNSRPAALVAQTSLLTLVFLMISPEVVQVKAWQNETLLCDFSQKAKK